MEYVKGKCYFNKIKDKIKEYPYLNKDIETDILIVGGGINGAIANYFLSKNYNVCLIDKGRFGQGCTSCATALVEYQLDQFASELKKEMTQDEIIAIYKMGIYSIKKISEFINIYGNKCQFKICPSLLYSDCILDKNTFMKEYNFRIQNGFNCQFITKNTNPYNFKLKYGLYCKDGGAEINAYAFAKQLFDNSSNQQSIYENTEFLSYKERKNSILVTLSYGHTIKCKKIIFATGFNFEHFDNDNLCDRFYTYTIITNPIKDLNLTNSTLIQDNKSPYHYLRTLPDGRIIYGGQDTKFSGKISNCKAEKMYFKLENNLKQMFPQIKDKFKINYKFCGAFGSTDNDLGLIGIADSKNVLYFLSCGANGITNAMYGVKIIDDIIKEKSNKLEHLFSPLRILNK